MSKPGEDRKPDIEQEHELNTALYARIKFNRLFLTLLLSSNGQSKMDNPEKLATQGTQDKHKSISHPFCAKYKIIYESSSI
jgi:hypothetical protein